MDGIEQEILEQVKRLDPEQKKLVLDFARRLVESPQETVKSRFERLKETYFPNQDLDDLTQAILEDQAEELQRFGL
jgi:hypothetical protein